MKGLAELARQCRPFVALQRPAHHERERCACHELGRDVHLTPVVQSDVQDAADIWMSEAGESLTCGDVPLDNWFRLRPRGQKLQRYEPGPDRSFLRNNFFAAPATTE